MYRYVSGGMGRRQGGWTSEARSRKCVHQDELPVTAEDSCWRRPQISDLVALFGGRKGIGMPKPASGQGGRQPYTDQASS